MDGWMDGWIDRYFNKRLCRSQSLNSGDFVKKAAPADGNKGENGLMSFVQTTTEYFVFPLSSSDAESEARGSGDTTMRSWLK